MSNQMWKKLGFRENPYNTKPLTASMADVELLIGREKNQIEFQTVIESEKQGVFVLSGVPGVGKTSFLNIQQYLLESDEAMFGQRMLAARTLCPIQPSDEPKHIALRCIQSFCKSIEEYCNIVGHSIPHQTSEVSSWIHQKKPATINIGVSILGSGLNGGREIHLPSINETTYETLVEILTSLSYEVKSELNFEGSFIVLDNVENLHEDDFSDCLTTFRDTLFTIPYIWWVIIGQSGLYSLIQSKNPKIAQRLSSTIELNPISVGDLIKAVDVRVKTFHDSGQSDGSSPISKEVYLKLFESSNGEIRFVFKYCQEICVRLVQNVRTAVLDMHKQMTDDVFHEAMGKYLVNRQVGDSFSYDCLREIIEKEFRGLNLSQTEKSVLKKIGELKKVSPKDFALFKPFGIDTMQDLTSNYLVELRNKQLLFRRQIGQKLTYELRGISVFALEYGLLDESFYTSTLDYDIFEEE